MGEIFALAHALAWAISALMVRTQIYHLGPLIITAARTTVAGIAFLPVFFCYPLEGYLSLPIRAYTLIFGAMGIALLFGDPFFIRSLAILGAARAMPITNAFPVFTLFISPAVTGEKITAGMALGTLTVFAGVTLIAMSEPPPGEGLQTPEGLGKYQAVKGIFYGLIAALAWAVSACINKLAFMDYPLNPLMISAVRIPVLAVASWTLLPFEDRWGGFPRWSGRTWVAIFGAGLIGMFLGSLLFLEAIARTSVTRVVTLACTAPLFAVPLAVWFLDERLNRRMVIGTVLTMLGAWTVSAPPEWQFFPVF